MWFDEEMIFISRRSHKQWADRVSSILLSVAMAGEPETFKVMPMLLFWWSFLFFGFFGVWDSSKYVRGKGSASHTLYQYSMEMRTKNKRKEKKGCVGGKDQGQSIPFGDFLSFQNKN